MQAGEFFTYVGGIFPQVGSTASFACMVDISEKIVLSYKNVTGAVVPDSLVQLGPDGRKFMRIRPSHPIVCKLASADHVDLYKQCKNPSLNQGECFALLRKKQEEALEMASAQEEKEEENIDKQLFKAEKPLKKKPKLASGPETLELDVGGIQVEVLKPSSHKDKDLCVLVDSTMLAATFDFLATDVENCFKDDITKRPYKKKHDPLECQEKAS